MSARNEKALLRAVATLLETVAASRDEDASAEGAPMKPPDCSGDGNRRGKWLSHLENRIVEHLSAQPDYVSGESIAAALGEPYQHRFKAILTNLVDREILDGLTGSGYRIARG